MMTARPWRRCNTPGADHGHFLLQPTAVFETASMDRYSLVPGLLPHDRWCSSASCRCDRRPGPCGPGPGHRRDQPRVDHRLLAARAARHQVRDFAQVARRLLDLDAPAHHQQRRGVGDQLEGHRRRGRCEVRIPSRAHPPGPGWIGMAESAGWVWIHLRGHFAADDRASRHGGASRRSDHGGSARCRAHPTRGRPGRRWLVGYPSRRAARRRDDRLLGQCHVQRGRGDGGEGAHPHRLPGEPQWRKISIPVWPRAGATFR